MQNLEVLSHKLKAAGLAVEARQVDRMIIEAGEAGDAMQEAGMGTVAIVGGIVATAAVLAGFSVIAIPTFSLMLGLGGAGAALGVGLKGFGMFIGMIEDTINAIFEIRDAVSSPAESGGPGEPAEPATPGRGDASARLTPEEQLLKLLRIQRRLTTRMSTDLPEDVRKANADLTKARADLAIATPGSRNYRKLEGEIDELEDQVTAFGKESRKLRERIRKITDRVDVLRDARRTSVDTMVNLVKLASSFRTQGLKREAAELDVVASMLCSATIWDKIKEGFGAKKAEMVKKMTDKMGEVTASMKKGMAAMKKASKEVLKQAAKKIESMGYYPKLEKLLALCGKLKQKGIAKK